MNAARPLVRHLPAKPLPDPMPVDEDAYRAKMLPDAKKCNREMRESCGMTVPKEKPKSKARAAPKTPRAGSVSAKAVALLRDGKRRTTTEISTTLGVNHSTIWSAMDAWAKHGLLVRETDKANHETWWHIADGREIEEYVPTTRLIAGVLKAEGQPMTTKEIADALGRVEKSVWTAADRSPLVKRIGSRPSSRGRAQSVWALADG